MKKTRPVSGGCINRAALLELENGLCFFLKFNQHAPAGMFQAEADGLNLLRDAGEVRVPRVVSLGQLGAGLSYLLLEDLNMATKQPFSEQFEDALGRGLAGIHKKLSSHYGLSFDNYIGTTPQANTPSGDWVDFFLSRRLEPLCRRLKAAGADSRSLSQVQNAFPHIEGLLDPRRKCEPSLLHGDLWSGNIMRDAEGRPCLIDPAVYFGDRETDIAMTELFGGFSQPFRSAYEEAWPVADGYERRRDIYNLYHLLNHALLFGGGYLANL